MIFIYLLIAMENISLDGSTKSLSRTTRALGKAGLKVAHVYSNAYYGADEAALTLDEVVAWAECHSSSQQDEGCIRYNVDFHSEVQVSPQAIHDIFVALCHPSRRCCPHASFKLLGSVSIYHDGHFEQVPGGKEDVFRDQQIPLIEKRRLMQFLLFSVGEYEDTPEFQGKEDVPFTEFLSETFSLSENLAGVVAFALAYCSSADGECLVSRLD